MRLKLKRYPQTAIYGKASAGGGSITLDTNGSATAVGVGFAGSTTATFSTSQTNDVVVAFIAYNGGGTISITSPTLGTWNLLGTDPGTSCGIWWKATTSALTSEVVTVTDVIAGSYVAVAIMAFHGANTTTPFDSSALLASSTGFMTSDPLPGTTTGANEMVIAGFRNQSVGTPTAGSGWTGVNSASSFFLAEYKSAPTAGSVSATETTGAGDTNGSVMAALKP